MAQIRRDLNKITENISENAREALNFGSERRSEVINSLNASNQARIKKLAEQAVSLNNADSIRSAFQEVIKEYTKLLAQTKQESEKSNYEKIIAERKANLQLFNQEVERLSHQNSKDKPSDLEINEEQFTRELKIITDKIYEKEKKSIFNFIVEPNEHYRELEDYINKITSIPRDKKNLIKSTLLNKNTERLMKYFGSESYKFYAIYCNSLNEKIEKLSHEYAGTEDFDSAYKDLLKFIDGMIANSNNTNINVSFIEESQTLTISFPQNIIKRVERPIISQKVLNYLDPNSLTEEEKKEKEIKAFTEQCESFIAVYFQEYEKTINTLKDTLDRSLLDNQLDTLLEDKAQFSRLTRDEKIRIINEIGRRYDSEKIDKYGKGFIDYIRYVIIKNLSEIPFDKLFAAEYGTKEFERYYDLVYAGLEKLRNAVYRDQMSSNFIKDMSYDDTTQKFTIEFANKNVPKYEKQIMSDKAISAIKNEITTNQSVNLNIGDIGSEILAEDTSNEFADFFDDDFTVGLTTPAEDANKFVETLNSTQTSSVTPVENQTPTYNVSEPTNSFISSVSTPDRDTFIKNYLIKTQELNNAIELLNNINKKLEANLIHDFLNPTTLENAIELEKEADKLDQKIIASKLELTQERVEFKSKYNEYILTLPEVQNNPLAEIKFTNNDLTAFVTLVDEQLATAENQIIELDKERQAALAAEEKTAIANRINTIMEFIDSQNSLIARRIVVESAKKDFDIVNFLQNRREKKKEIRAKVKMAYEATKTVEVTPNEDVIEVKDGEGIPLPPSESRIPFVEPVKVTPIKVEKEETHYEIPDATTPVESKESVKEITEPVTSEPLDDVENIEDEDFDRAREETDYSGYKWSDIADLIGEINGDTSYEEEPIEPDDQPTKQDEESSKPNYRDMVYADDDPMKYNKIRELPEEDFDKVFEVSASENPNDSADMTDEYLAELYEKQNYKKTAEAQKNEDTEYVVPVIPEDENVDSNVIDSPILETSNEIIPEKGNSLELDVEPSIIGEKASESTSIAEPEDNSTSITKEVDNDLVKTLGLTIIDWIDNKGIIIKDEFKNFYLSEAGILENDYENALSILQELNVIDVETYTISAKMSKDKFNEAILEYNQNMEQEKIPQKVSIELQILELNPLITAQKVSRDKGLICSGDVVTISLINKGIKVKYSEELRTKLSELNAKLRLIKKDNLHVRATTDISAAEQEVKFKDGRDIDHKEYKVDIRVPGNPEPILEYDLEGQIDEEKRRTI